MADLSTLNGQTVAVMGLGKSGAATVRALRAAGLSVAAWDDKAEIRERAISEGLLLVDLARVDWAEIGLLVWSPGIPHRHPAPHPVAVAAARAGVAMVCDIELLYTANQGANFIGITGTNGKSTTTTLVGHLLGASGSNVAVGGNLGTPALDLPPFGQGGSYVLELSSYQLELLDQARFDIGVLLNITPDHLARHGGMDGYIEAKASLFDRLQPGGVAIVGVDDDYAAAIEQRLSKRKNVTVRAISAEKFLPGGVSAADGILVDDCFGKAEKIVDLTAIKCLPGRHNWQNACAAYAVARACAMPVDLIVRQLRSYPGLRHRQELVAIIDGVRYVNDSKATNADASAKALACYDQIYWIVGGQAKEGGIASLWPHFPRVRHAFLIGEAAQSFAASLSGKVAYDQCGTLEVAIAKARQRAITDGRDGAVVLLSPACASWDQFTSFEHRGDVFRSAVDALPGDRSAA